jgi:hypothetical protein
VACPTDRADDTGAAELRRRVVFGVEAGEPLDTGAAIFLVEKGVAHCDEGVVSWKVGMGLVSTTSERKLFGGELRCKGGWNKKLSTRG